MKKAFYFFLFISAAAYLHAQSGFQCDSTNDLYWYNEKCISLETLESVDFNGTPIYSFKMCSPYKYQFIDYKKLQIAIAGSVKFEITNKNELKISTSKKTITVPSPCKGGSSYFKNAILFTDAKGVSYFEHCDETGYTITRYNQQGEVVSTSGFAGDSVVKMGNSSRYNTYRILAFYTGGKLIFDVNEEIDPDKTGTLVFDLETQQINQYQIKCTGYAINTNGDVVGLFYKQGKDLAFRMTNSTKEYIIQTDIYLRTCIGIIKEDLLVIACYGPISSGSFMFCYNLKTEKTEWVADVEQLMTSHSKYFNYVYLSLYKNKVILEGQEAGGSYLQIFDLLTGKKIYNELHKGQ